eukprot:4557578-Prymnesium_polylepis.1
MIKREAKQRQAPPPPPPRSACPKALACVLNVLNEDAAVDMPVMRARESCVHAAGGGRAVRGNQSVMFYSDAYNTCEL